MGIKSLWYENLQETLLKAEISCELISDPEFILINAVELKVVINCISLLNEFEPDDLLAVQEFYFKQNMLLIQLWEDVWASRQPQVLNRLFSLMGQNRRLHGRKMQLVLLDKYQSDAFLVDYHIQGPALARHKFGLLNGDELVAVATFSGSRLMKHKTDGYRSAELIRFATKAGYTVAGGLTKLIKHFASQVKTNDVMSYADRDWSMGKGYESAGFTFDSMIPPSELWLNTASCKRYFSHRLPLYDMTPGDEPVIMAEQKFIKIFNTGNLKYILYL